MRQLYLLILLLIAVNAAIARPIIIDHDGSIDDMLGMLYLLQTSATIKAVTIAATGEAHCQPALSNTSALLHEVHKESIPIACGSSTPLNGNHAFPAWIRRSADNMMGLNEKLHPHQAKMTLNADNLLFKSISENKEPVDIVALGPLTNLASLIRIHPDVKTNIHMIYIMGGAVHTSGNVYPLNPKRSNKLAEWNFYIDPYATATVFQSGVPITLIPLDITNKIPIDENFYNLLNQIPRPGKLGKQVRYVFNKNKHEFLTQGWYFWDTLTAYVAANEKCEYMSREKLKVITRGRNAGGLQTNSSTGNTIQICKNIDKAAFQYRVFNALLKL